MTYRERDNGMGPYEDEYRGFDIRDDETSRGPLILTLAIGVLIVFAAVVWNTYRQGVRPQDGALPMVVAESQPYKRVPDDRGGVEIEDLDRRLYDVIDGSERQPEPTPAAGSAQDNLTGAPPMDLRPSSESGSVDQTAGSEATGEAESGSAEKPSGMQISVDAGPQETADQPSPAVETQQSGADPQTAETRSEPATEQAATPEKLSGQPRGFDYASGGEFFVQISALRSEAAATQAWQKVTAANPELFASASMSVERADLGAKGVFYRLRAGTFGSRASASEFCDAYKAQGGDCIVVRETA